MKRKLMSKEPKMDIYRLGASMGIPKHKIHTIIKSEKMEEPVKITQTKLLKLHKKYYGGE